VLSARTTGTTSAFTATGGPLSDEVVRAGTDAEYSIDGGPTLKSHTNVVDEAVAGVRLTFKGLTASPASVTVGTAALDKEAVKTKVQAFVDAYNDLVKTTRGMLDERPVAGAKTAEQAKTGALYGDTALTALLSRLRTSVADTVKGNASAMDELRELGVSTGASTGGRTSEDAKMGLLVLDDAVLTKALEDPQAVRQMLGGLSGVDGFSQRLEGLTGSYVGAKGTLTGRIQETDKALVDLQRQMTGEDTRLKAREDRLKAQFAAMESALAASQTQQQWLTGQLAKL
jgi:flagellar hook-associated protein 2